MWRSTRVWVDEYLAGRYEREQISERGMRDDYFAT